MQHRLSWSGLKLEMFIILPDIPNPPKSICLRSEIKPKHAIFYFEHARSALSRILTAFLKLTFSRRRYSNANVRGSPLYEPFSKQTFSKERMIGIVMLTVRRPRVKLTNDDQLDTGCQGIDVSVTSPLPLILRWYIRDLQLPFLVFRVLLKFQSSVK